MAHGRRVSVGRVRVDAARAIAKLREYQLPDRTAWILEAIRAAVASGATRIDVQGDSNDVWLSWEGEAWDPELIANLLDELVSPEEARHGQRARLLATAVNSALGLGPAHLDIYCIPSKDAAEKVCFTPTVLHIPEDDTPAPLELLSAEWVPAPEGCPESGMVVHLRRRASLENLVHLVRGEPPELRLARLHCGDLAVPIRVRDIELGNGEESTDLLRLELGQDIDGFLALTPPQAATTAGFEATMDVAEHGVVIASYILPLVESPRAPVPLRLFVNADRMPTNASRSEVRQDTYPVKNAMELAAKLLPDLCERLAEALSTAEPDSDRYARLRAGALALIGCKVAGPDWPMHARTLAAPFRQLGNLELVKSAVGVPRAFCSDWTDDEAHFGREPYDQELAPWLGDTLWIPPGDIGARRLVGAGIQDAVPRAKRARKQLRAQKRFRKHEQREPRFGRVPRHWIHLRLDAPLPGSSTQPPLDGIEGEVCLPRRGRDAEMLLLFEGREIEDIELESAVPFRAIVSSSVLTPDHRYRTVYRDIHYHNTESCVLDGVIRGIEALALALEGERPPEGFTISPEARENPGALRLLIRDAIGLAWQRSIDLSRSAPLMRARIWQVKGVGLMSAEELGEYPVLATTLPQAQVHVPPGRITIFAHNAERVLLRKMLEPDTKVVLYEPTRVPELGDVASSLAEDLGGLALIVRRDGLRGAISWLEGDAESRLMVHHAGVRVGAQDHVHTLYPCALSIDSDSVVPSWDWSELDDLGATMEEDFPAWERALLRATALLLLGETVRDIRPVGASVQIDDAPALALFSVLRSCEDPAELLGAGLLERLRSAPLFEVWTGNRLEPISAGALAQRFEERIPYLTFQPQRAIDSDWTPLVAGRSTAQFAGWLAQRHIGKGDLEIVHRLRLAERKQRLEVHVAQSPPPFPFVKGLGIDVRDGDLDGRLGLRPFANRDLEIVVCIEGRFFHRELVLGAPPALLAVDASIEIADERFAAVPEETLQRLEAMARAGIDELLLFIGRESPSELCGVAGSLLAARIGEHDMPDETLATLRGAPAFRTIQGSCVSMDEATRGGAIHVAKLSGEWLGPDSGSPDLLDAPVLCIDDDDIEALIRGVANGMRRLDVSEAAQRLQTQRRVERGLVARPTLQDVPSALKRTFVELGNASPKLGVGEIGLIAGKASTVRSFSNGEKLSTTNIDTWPPIAVAMEGDFRAKTIETTKLQQMTWRLLEEVLASEDPASLPEWLRRQLVRALLQGGLSEGVYGRLAGAQLLETTTGERATWNAVLDQATRFEEVWWTRSREELRPLDIDRIAIRLHPDELPDVVGSGLPLLDATKELRLDQVARKNRDKPVVMELALTTVEENGALCVAKLGHGDGGVVAPLKPDMAFLRGIRVHREMHPLGTEEDPCDWPTIAVVDDPRLTPTRTWSGPVRDDALAKLRKKVEKASNQALKKLVEAPKSEAMTAHWVGPFVERAVPALKKRGVVIRGRLWLGGPPEPKHIALDLGHSKDEYSPEIEVDGIRHAIPVSGRLMVYPPKVMAPTELLHEIVLALYPKLLRQLVSRKLDPDLVAAHIAYGLSLGVIEPNDAKSIRFSCFDPEPLDASTLTDLLLHSSEPMGVDDPELIDDGSHVARVLKPLLRRRLGGQRRVPRPPPVFDLSDVYDTATVEPSPRPSHPLDLLAQLCEERLAALELGYRVAIDEGQRTIAEVRDHSVFLSGTAPRLRALSDALSSESKTSRVALDLLIAHLVTALNEAYSVVTDATEEFTLHRLMANEPATETTE